MRRQVNTRFLLWTLGTVVVSAVLVHFLHAFQVRRNTGALLQQAQSALDKGDRGRALHYWRQYLVLEPDDLEVLIKYGLGLDESAGPSERFEAWRVLNRVLARDPQRDDVRFRLVFCEIHLGLYREAIKDLKALLPRWHKNPGELEHMLGWCCEAVEAYDDAEQAFGEAARKDPGRLASYILRAEVLRHRLDRADEADQVMEAVAQANPRNHRASLALADYHRQQNRLEKAAEEIERALRLELGKPRERAELLAAAADLAQAQGDAARARTFAEHGLQLHPQHVGLYRVIAGIAVRSGQRPEAIARLRQGLQNQPDNADLSALLADLLIDDGAAAEAERLVDTLRKKGVPLADYLQARLLTTREQWQEAITLLERAAERIGPGSEWAAQVNAVLGLCYERLGDTEQQLTAFSRAVAQNPSWTAARLGLASALRAAGRADEALQQYRAVSKAPDAPAETAALVARTLLMSNLRLPAAQRNWSEVERAIEQAEKTSPDGLAIALLRADLLAVQGQLAAARKLLSEARQKHPNSAAVWCAIIDVAVREGRQQDALAVLAEAEKKIGDRVELRLARTRLEVLVRGRDARPALEALTANLAPLPRADQVRLLREMAELWTRLGDTDAAERCWRQFLERRPGDLRGRVLLLELLLASGRISQAQQLVSELRQLEGNNGVLRRYGEAAVWTEQARRHPKALDRQRLADARNRLAELARQRPDWARIPLLEARIAEIEGDLTLAMDRYVRAMDLGEHEPGMMSRLVKLLYERRDTFRADQALRRLEEHGTLGKDLMRLGAEIALANRDLPRALRFAEQTVPPVTRDYRDLVWLARIQHSAGDVSAEATLRRALTHDGHAPDVWIALVEFLVRTDRPGEAEAVLQEAAAKLPSDRLVPVLVRGHELLGRLADAEHVLQKTLAEQPHDLALLFETAEFYRRNDLCDKAVPALRRLLDPAAAAPGNVTAQARRHLAVLLAARGEHSAALRLLDENRPSPSEERARALVLAHRPGQQAKAVALFEKTLSGPPLTPEEHAWLVQTYDLADQPAKAQNEMIAVLAAYGDNPQFLAYCVGRLLQRDEIDDAQSYLERLKRMEPHSPRTQHLEASLRKARPAN